MGPLFRVGRGKTVATTKVGRGHRRVEDISPDFKLGLLRASELFRELSEEQMGHVEKMTIMTRCERGRVIYRPGETGEALFLLKQGQVHVYRVTPEGKKLITAVINPGTLFGDMAFTGHAMRDGFAEAVEDSTLCVMSRHDVEALIRLYPEIGIRLIDILSRRMRELESQLEESALRNMQSRVAAALLRVREREKSDKLSVTHQELADLIGTHRETVTRILGELRDSGIIDLERRCISIKNVSRLHVLVGQ